jgi:hypothetical protein
MKKIVRLKRPVHKTQSRVDFLFLKQTSLPVDRALHTEGIKSGMTARGIRRALRKAIQAGETGLERYTSKLVIGGVNE